MEGTDSVNRPLSGMSSLAHRHGFPSAFRWRYLGDVCEKKNTYLKSGNGMKNRKGLCKRVGIWDSERENEGSSYEDCVSRDKRLWRLGRERRLTIVNFYFRVGAALCTAPKSFVSRL